MFNYCAHSWQWRTVHNRRTMSDTEFSWTSEKLVFLRPFGLETFRHRRQTVRDTSAPNCSSKVPVYHDVSWRNSGTGTVVLWLWHVLVATPLYRLNRFLAVNIIHGEGQLTTERRGRSTLIVHHQIENSSDTEFQTLQSLYRPFPFAPSSLICLLHTCIHPLPCPTCMDYARYWKN